MTVPVFSDAVAIDTNVFLHLLNSQENTGLHINGLLKHLKNLDIRLVVDDKDRIFGEYLAQVGPVIARVDDQRDEIHIMRYWVLYANRCTVIVNQQDRLMSAIKRVITERNESVDRSFVYVALRSGRILLTNDKLHILYGPPHSKARPRRDRLLGTTRKIRPSGSDILSSVEAYSAVGQP